LWRATDGLVATAWYDRRVVYHISTIHAPFNANEQPSTIMRRSGDGRRVEVKCPPAQLDYQNHMGGVDLADQLVKTFSVVKKSRKAWKKLFGYGLEVCLLNSFIILKKSKPHCKLKFLDCRKEVARQLIGGKRFRGKLRVNPVNDCSEEDARDLMDFFMNWLFLTTEETV